MSSIRLSTMSCCSYLSVVLSIIAPSKAAGKADRFPYRGPSTDAFHIQNQTRVPTTSRQLVTPATYASKMCFAVRMLASRQKSLSGNQIACRPRDLGALEL
ncbi:hypothetical protein BDW02DRAFT_105223 [Decorospora gaudefroyi]|uniref:Secreted protein n=1 Tax=Decorospora gaudefroyi TaxID=184978 RepID=A0A6A5K1X9_9PLEO|nr:hypothetical protein BDW02DRAFT_105223 [Decorospora gaudefroyi]